MAKTIKKHWDIALIIGVGLFLTIVAMLVVDITPPVPSAEAATQTVSVSATVQEWITIGVYPTSVSLTPDLVDTAGATAIGSSTDISITIGTNNAAGWNITLLSANGALTTSTYYIYTTDTTSTITAGTDMYGVQATTSVSGVDIKPYYDYWGTNVVGTASTTAQTLADKTTSNSSTTVATMEVQAAADDQQEPDTYTDTLTLTATGGT